MKIKALFMSIMLCFGISTVYAYNDESAFIEQFASLSARADNLNLWPGFQLNAFPFIIGDQEKGLAAQLYAFNLQAKNTEWQLLPFNNNKPVYYMPQDGIGFARFKPSLEQPYLMVDGQNAIILSLPPGFLDTVDSNQELVEILFFYYTYIQSPHAKEIFEQNTKNQNYPYDEYNNFETVALHYLELEVLSAYLKTNDLSTLKNFVAVHQHRAKLLKQQDIDFEDQSIIGRADYVAKKASYQNLSEIMAVLQDRARPFDRIIHDDPSWYYDNIKMNMDSFILPAVEFTLDALEPGWQEKVENQQASVNELLRRHFNMSDNEVNTRLLSSMKIHGFGEIREGVRDVLGPYLKEMKRVEGYYQNAPGVELEMSVASDNVRSVAYVNFSINKLKVLFWGLVEFAASFDDENKTQISLKKIPYLYLEDFGASDTYSKLRLKLSLDAELELDNLKMSLDNFVKQKRPVSFRELSIRDKTQPKLWIKIRTADTGAYVLAVEDDHLVIKSPNAQNKARGQLRLPSNRSSAYLSQRLLKTRHKIRWF